MKEFTLYLNDTDIHQFRGWLDEYANSVPDRTTPSNKRYVSNLVDWQPWRDSLRAAIPYYFTDGSGITTISGWLVTANDGTEVLEGPRVSTTHSCSLMEFYFRQVGKRLKVEVRDIIQDGDFNPYITKLLYQLCADWPDAAEFFGKKYRKGKEGSSEAQQDERPIAADKEKGTTESCYQFKKIGDYWSLKFEDEEALMKDTKGMVQLHRLISYPDIECGVEELYEMVNKVKNPLGVPKGDIGMDDFENLSNSSFSRYRNIDKQAFDNYKKRLREICEERKFLVDKGDDTSKLDWEVNFIEQQLSGGELTNPRERARQAVYRNIQTAIKNISKEMPSFGKHLKDRAKTGFECYYAGDKLLNWITN